ncbi:uncharacterized protein LOC110936027 isoform X1 [Helianthus annuus]|uniref:uncharacterized protein LOC110936027 isoform X1 n=1 Tax=Helianthus annuus TaxID=4232 RepID=UPI000B8F771A|nr:uncharacterized protein LOC110936027 isoform X1 [Helianthus annuus]
MLKPFTAEALLLRLEPTTTAAAAPKSLAILSHRYFWIMDFPSRLIKEVVKVLLGSRFVKSQPYQSHTKKLCSILSPICGFHKYDGFPFEVLIKSQSLNLELLIVSFAIIVCHVVLRGTVIQSVSPITPLAFISLITLTTFYSLKDASSYGTKKISAKRLNDVACQIGLASFDTSKVFVFFLFKHFAILICPIDK